MAKFDDAIQKLNKENFIGYVGNPPSNKTEYDAIKNKMFLANAPTWAEIQTEIDNIPNIEDLKLSAKTKLMNGEALTEDEANVMVGL
jgi:spermidine/putrescine-binding protein